MKKMLYLSILSIISQLAIGAEIVDRTNSGIVTGSSQHRTEESAQSLFDGYVDTKWLADSASAWAQYEFENDRAYAINSYTMTSANDASDRDPKSWEFLGSNDGGLNWTVVDEQQDVIWSARFETKTFKCTNTIPYKIYRLNVLENYGSASLMQIAELNLIDNGISRTSYSNITWSSHNSWNQCGIRAFDNHQTQESHTKWLTAKPNTTGWLEYEFLDVRAYSINGYTVTSANDYPSRDPRAWTLQGSHDGVNWDILDTQEDQIWQDGGEENRYTLKQYDFDNNIAYKYYKIDITANNGSADLLGLAEIELLERPLDGSAEYVSPTEAAIEVSEDAMLEWTTGDNSDIAGHYVYLGESPDQMALVTPVALDAATTSFDPDLNTDATYYWQVEEALMDNGALRSAGDPNNIMGRVRYFTTLTSVVVFNPEYPVNTIAGPGESATFTVKATDPLEGTIEYQWYFNDKPLVEGDKYQGIDSDTLVILDVQESDEGDYFCSAVNASGNVSYSNEAKLFIKKTLAHWTFDSTDLVNGQYVDLVGENNATVEGLTVFSDGIVDYDMVTDPVSDGAILISDDPNGCAAAGTFNPGEETGRFSISAWVNYQEQTTDVSWNIIASKRDGWNTLDESYWQFLTTSTGSVKMQSKGLTVVETDTGLIDENQWHHVVVTFDGSYAKIYVDGMEEASGGFILADGPDATFRIGRNDQVIERFEGAIDDMLVYNYDLSAENVVDLFYAETGTPKCIYGSPSGDFDGNCVVDLFDFATVAGSWLDHGYYPVQP